MKCTATGCLNDVYLKAKQDYDFCLGHLHMQSAYSADRARIPAPPLNREIGLPKEDKRYNTPKSEPSANIEDIEKVIGSTEIYRRARALINSKQRRQVGYGMEKYPEPLSADTWSTIETIDHIIEESIDQLHYLVMLRIKLESQGE